MKVKVAINGYGTIGKRVADAVSMQDDMVLVGVSKRSPNFDAFMAVKKGYSFYAPPENIYALESAGTTDEYFMMMAYLVAARSTCIRRKVGAVIVKDKRVLSTGYNGPPKGMAHCDVTGCLREELNVPSGERHELCRGLHAEQNAVI